MDIQHEMSVSIVKDYGNYLEFISVYNGYTFEQLSYSKWTVNEILMRLKESNSEPPLLVIESFRDKMDEYSHSNSKANYIFSVASDTAQDIVDLFQ